MKKSQHKSKAKSMKKSMRGGAPVMPSEFYGVNSGRYFEAGTSGLADASLQQPPNFTAGRTYMPGTYQLVGPDLYPSQSSCGGQLGGSRGKSKSKYDKITNPVTKKQVSVYSKVGKSVLRKYLQQQ